MWGECPSIARAGGVDKINRVSIGFRQNKMIGNAETEAENDTLLVQSRVQYIKVSYTCQERGQEELKECLCVAKDRRQRDLGDSLVSVKS